ncbi:MAG: hypothetical protein ACK4GB_08300, partial [Tepidimonas sp.]
AFGGVGLYLALGEPPAAVSAAPRARSFDGRALATLWSNRRVRSSVLGYFGHMWELYTMWVLFTALAERFPLALLLPGLALGPALGLLAMRPLWRSPHR